MVHKNLRTLLYYVVGVTAVCLMIEVTTKIDWQSSCSKLIVTVLPEEPYVLVLQVSKRSSGLDPALYVVETADSQSLVSPPPAASASSAISSVNDDEVEIHTSCSFTFASSSR